MTAASWKSIETAPFDWDVELAVLEDQDIHALVFRCRRTRRGWINATTGQTIDVRPTHWREWQDGSTG
jgi:hypothetical protein